MSLKFIEVVQGTTVRVDAILEFYTISGKNAIAIVTYDTYHQYDFNSEEDTKEYYEWLVSTIAGDDEIEET